MIAVIDGDVLLHATLWETTNYEKAISKLHYNIDDYTSGAFCNHCIIAVGPYDGKNYRDDLYPEYKQTTMRVKGRDERPEHFQKVKNYLYSLENVVVADNIEADDLLGVLSAQLGDNCVIVTVDKDMDQLAGRHFNPRRETYYIVKEPEANRFFLEQLVKGDPMDKIPGLPKHGPVAAKVMNQKSETIKDFAEAVIEAYKKVYKEDWQNYLLANAKLLYLQRKDYDWFTMKTFNDRFMNEGTARV